MHFCLNCFFQQEQKCPYLKRPIHRLLFQYTTNNRQYRGILHCKQIKFAQMIPLKNCARCPEYFWVKNMYTFPIMIPIRHLFMLNDLKDFFLTWILTPLHGQVCVFPSTLVDKWRKQLPGTDCNNYLDLINTLLSQQYVII